MSFRKTLPLALFFFTLCFLFPKTIFAVNPQPSGETLLVKVQEAVQYLFTFKTENKVQVLENNAEKRLTWAQEYAEAGNEDGIKNMIQSYQQIKGKQVDLLGKVDGEVLGAVAERTIEQQETMEKLKVVTSDAIDNWIVDAEEKAVNGVAERIVVVNGAEGQTEFFNEVKTVWAPGTGPGGGEAGVVIEGGQMQFAPGTSAGGPSGADIKTVEVKTGGATNNVVETGGDGGLAPGTTTGGSEGNTIDPGTVDEPASEGETWLAP